MDDPRADERSGGLARHLVKLPILDRVKAVKDILLRELGAIHSHVEAVHAAADSIRVDGSLMLRELGALRAKAGAIQAATDSMRADDSSMLRELGALRAEAGAIQAATEATLASEPSRQRELADIRTEVSVVAASTDGIRADIATVQAATDALLANDSPLLQAALSLVEALQQARLEVDRQGQILLNCLTLARQERGRQVRGVLEAIERTSSSIEQNSRVLAEIHEAAAQHQSRVETALRELRTPPAVEDLFDGRAIVHRGEPSAAEREVGLMAYLYSYLPSRAAVDVGANVGDVSEGLLEAGYEVYAFEPNPSAFARLSERLGQRQAFHGVSLALGSTDEERPLHLVSDLSGCNRYRDATLYGSLIHHSMPDDLPFTDDVRVNVRRLDALHRSGQVPAAVGLVKIDTEGFDLEVIRGMGDHRYPVVVAEYWDPSIPFGVWGARNRLDDIVEEMRSRGYHWYVVFYRIWGKEGVSFYCNHPRSIERSYGNAFFFQDQQIFARALDWCLAVLPPTYVGR